MLKCESNIYTDEKFCRCDDVISAKFRSSLACLDLDGGGLRNTEGSRPLSIIQNQQNLPEALSLPPLTMSKFLAIVCSDLYRRFSI